MSDPELYLVYDFGFDGLHNGARRVLAAELDNVLGPILKRAQEEKRTVIVTDTADFCMLHMEKGELLFPSRQEIAAAKAREPW